MLALVTMEASPAATTAAVASTGSWVMKGMLEVEPVSVDVVVVGPDPPVLMLSPAVPACVTRLLSTDVTVAMSTGWVDP
jgi:hypothetical protein